VSSDAVTSIVGVLNVTPDSFSDGGRLRGVDEAIAAALSMVDAGAGWIDVGGESTRPGAAVVPEAEEQARVVPVIRELARRLAGRGTRLSVDTYKAETARAALAAGATIVNDVSGGLLDPRILGVAAGAGAAIVVGHLRGAPADMMKDVRFDDIVGEVGAELRARVDAAHAAGCKEVWADPGIGFGKHTEHNLALLRHLPALCKQVGAPIMVGVSRKRFIGEITGKPTTERAFGIAAAVTAAILGGAAAVRVHDVPAMRDVVAVADAIAGGSAS